MANELIVVRGGESELARLRADLDTFLAGEKIAPAQLPVSAPVAAKRRLTDRPVLGHEALVEIAIEIGKAVAVGAISSVMKDLVVGWIKEQARRRGLIAESKGG